MIPTLRLVPALCVGTHWLRRSASSGQPTDQLCLGTPRTQSVLVGVFPRGAWEQERKLCQPACYPPCGVLRSVRRAISGGQFQRTGVSPETPRVTCRIVGGQ
jgi:hypothetical protein